MKKAEPIMVRLTIMEFIRIPLFYKPPTSINGNRPKRFKYIRETSRKGHLLSSIYKRNRRMTQATPHSFVGIEVGGSFGSISNDN